MGDALLSALGPGAALAGVLLVMGLAAGNHETRLPHLGLGALAPAAAVAATRAASLGRPGAIALAIAGGGLVGAVGWVIDRRARADGNVHLPLLPDFAVAGFALAVAVFFRPAVFVELPLGPLGGVATTGYSVGAAGVASVAAGAVALLGAGRRPAVAIWMAATAGGALAVLLGSGALSLLAAAATPVFTIADTIGLGLRAAAVGFVARWSTGWAVVAAVALGVGEAAARAVQLNALALLPTVVVLAAGVVAASATARTVESV